MIIYNALIVNEGKVFNGYIETDGQYISNVSEGNPSEKKLSGHKQQIDASGAYLMPGIIDTHVHFRDPGLTHKADIETESLAALTGGVTTYFDMPNTIPVTDSEHRIDEKISIAEKKSYANYGFYIAATETNIDTLENSNLSNTAGIKLFMGSSTGNMAVSRDEILHRIFSIKKLLAIHAEDDKIIKQNAINIAREYPDGEIPISRHPDIRSREACISATKKALTLAAEHNTKLHMMHISTAEELQIISDAKRQGIDVTCEACLLHLFFSDKDYKDKGSMIKCNPAVKSDSDRIALIEQCKPGGTIDTVSTDHAPHLTREKQGDALNAASGAPSAQFSLIAMLELAEEYNIPVWRIVELMCHNQAKLFNIPKRGFLKKGYHADMVLVQPNSPHTIESTEILSKCKWSPFESETFRHKINTVILNGVIAYPHSNSKKYAMSIFSKG